MLARRELSPILQKKAADSLQENEERIINDINLIREWLSKQPHINARMEEQFLLNFLRGCKYGVEKVKQKLEIYYTARSQLNDFFKNRDIHSPRTQELIRLGFILRLPNTEGEDGPRILLVRPGCYDPDKYAVHEIMSAITLASDRDNMLDDVTLICGYKVLFDVTGVKPSHLLQYNPTFMKQMSHIYQDGCAARLKGAYFFNLPAGLETVVNWGKNFLNEKNRKKIHIIGNGISELYQFVPKKLLPSEYGGDAGTIQEITSGMIQLIKDSEEILKAEEKYGVDECKRPSECKNADGLFGSMGTFRSLSLD